MVARSDLDARFDLVLECERYSFINCSNSGPLESARQIQVIVNNYSQDTRYKT